MMMEELSIMQRIVVWVLPVVFAITVHEVAHGWVARLYGDKTAWMLGRLTLNPIKHIDPVGTVLLPGLLLLSGTGFIFGWAKPVPVNPNNLRNPKRDMALVAMAGPAANLLMALGWAMLVRGGILIDTAFASLPMIYMGIAGISINLVLAIINLLPVPPLDGSRILSGILPDRLAWQYNRFEPYGFYLLLFLLITGLLGAMLGYPLTLAQQLFFQIAGLVPG